MHQKILNPAEALKQIIAGIGFVKSELANERIAVAVLTPSEEDEHSCFSDNTHRDIVNNYLGFKNILTATYKGKKYGDSLLDAVDSETKTRIQELMKSIEEKINSIDEVAKKLKNISIIKSDQKVLNQKLLLNLKMI